jgi:hypothetical protein
LSGRSARRRSELQAVYAKFETGIEKLNQQVEEQVCKHPGATQLMTHPGTGPITALGTNVRVSHFTVCRHSDGTNNQFPHKPR